MIKKNNNSSRKLHKKKIKDLRIKNLENNLKSNILKRKVAKKINGQIQNVAEFSMIKKSIARLYNNLGNKKWQKEF